MRNAPLFFLSLYLLAAGGALAETAAQVKPQVQYDTARDRLTLKAEQASLRQLLGMVAAKSGVEVLFDPQAEERVSLALRDQPLESGLKQLLKGKNSAFTYGEVASGKAPMLVGVRVLPRGKSDTGALRPLLDPAAEVGMHTQAGATGSGAKKARWEARLKQLSPEQRKALTAAAARRDAAVEKREAQRARAEAEQKEREAERQAREERLKATHPEYYAQRQQRIEENRQLRAQGIGRVKMNVEIKEK